MKIELDNQTVKIRIEHQYRPSIQTQIDNLVERLKTVDCTCEFLESHSHGRTSHVREKIGRCTDVHSHDRKAIIEELRRLRNQPYRTTLTLPQLSDPQ